MVISILISCEKNKCQCDIDPEIVIVNDSLITRTTSKILENGLTSYELYFNQFQKSKLYLKETEAYRLTINSSITNFAKVYELEKVNTEYKLNIQEFSQSQNGVRAIQLNNEKTITLTKPQWKSIKSKMHERCFWTIEADIEEDNNYLDGTQWSLEGVNGDNYCTDSKYHAISRISPDSSAFLNICKMFFEIDSLNMRNVHEW